VNPPANDQCAANSKFPENREFSREFFHFPARAFHDFKRAKNAMGSVSQDNQAVKPIWFIPQAHAFAAC
jgi:hypothetical protein